MAFIDARLSRQTEAGFSAVTLHDTSVRTLQSGRESRNANWAIARRRYTSKYAKWDRASRDELLSAIYVAHGQLHTFLFRDWNDFRVSLGSQGNAPAGSTPVQLRRLYTFGGTTVARDIHHPVAATVVLTQGGVAKPGTLNGGLFTPDTAWTEGEPLAASFDFDVRVRFARDDVEIIMPHRDIAEVVCDLIEVLPEASS